MKSLMLKLLTIALSVNTLFAGATEDKVLKFLSKSVKATKSYKIKNIKLDGSQDMKDMPGWKVYFVKIDLDLVGKDKSITINDKIFTNGKIVARDFLSISNARSIKSNFVPDFDNKFYNNKNIIAGKKNATNKLAIFSDPLCPFCIGFMPEIIEFVKKYPDQFVLYYYHFPLNIHPNSKTLIKASLAAKKEGMKDVDLKVYEEGFDFDKKDDQIALDTFNKVMGTKFTLKDINKKYILDSIEEDMKIVNELGLNGTPRLFTNGKIDNHRTMYKKLLKK